MPDTARSTPSPVPLSLADLREELATYTTLLVTERQMVSTAKRELEAAEHELGRATTEYGRAVHTWVLLGSKRFASHYWDLLAVKEDWVRATDAAAHAARKVEETRGVLEECEKTVEGLKKSVARREREEAGE